MAGETAPTGQGNPIAPRLRVGLGGLALRASPFVPRPSWPRQPGRGCVLWITGTFGSIHRQRPGMAVSAAGKERLGMVGNITENQMEGWALDIFGLVFTVRCCSQGFTDETGEPNVGIGQAQPQTARKSRTLVWAATSLKPRIRGGAGRTRTSDLTLIRRAL